MAQATDTKPGIDRRGFLRGAGVGAGTAALVAVTGTEAALAAEATPPETAGGGYRVTEHVRKAYATARL